MPPTARPIGTSSYEFGPFRVDFQQQRLLRDGQPVALTPKSFQLLAVLLRQAGQVVTKEELLQAVWPNAFVEETNLTRNVFALRKALGETEQDRYIVTVPGQGYRFARDVHSASQPELTVVAANESKVHVEVLEVPDRTWTKGIVAAAIIALASTVAAERIFLKSGPVLTNRDTVVLAEFANSTGDTVFDGTLRQGLAVELEQSPYLRLISDDRIQRTLRLMDREADARLTADAARELCERTAAAAVLQGSISRIGTRYVLGLTAKDCRTGDVLDQEQAQAAQKEDVLNALGAIATRFRTRVGESLATVQKYSTPLAEATTPSLDALKAYTAASQVHAAHGAVASLPLFRRAIELDPNFAMAYASLGRIYADLDQPDLAIANVEKSWQLRDRTSEAERFFLTANYEVLGPGNLEAAQQVCEAWAKEYPREPRAHAVLSGMTNKTPGRYEEALFEAQKTVELDPDFFAGYANVAINNLYLGKLSEAEEAIRTARARGLDADELTMFGYNVAFVENDATALRRETARARARPGGETWISAREAFTAAYFGRLAEARAITRNAVDEALQTAQPERAALWEAGAAVREALFGNKAAAAEDAVAALNFSHDREVEYGASFALALAGDSSRARSLADDLEKRSPENTAARFSYLPVLHALLALNRGESGHALEFLEAATPHELGVPLSSISGLYGALYPVYVRGLSYLAAQKGPEAVAEFQKVLAHRGIVANDPIGALAQWQLGRAYALAGDSAKARAAYEDFLRLWKDADRQIPVLTQARDESVRLK